MVEYFQRKRRKGWWSKIEERGRMESGVVREEGGKGKAAIFVCNQLYIY